MLLNWAQASYAQEYLVPLSENIALRKEGRPLPVQKATALALPFFEDFTGPGPYPDPARWTDRAVYVNNSMGKEPISRGVATFDGLDERGLPYDTLVPYSLVWADSLSSLPIDLTAYAPSDSLYLSFFYQAKGYGFAPKAGDSLMLYLLTVNGVWQKVWGTAGNAPGPFRQVMVPVASADYFHDGFRMRWINKATMGISNSNWNLDYIRFDANRRITDTAVRDIAFTEQARSILKDYSQMPFRHFKTQPNTFLAARQSAFIRNNDGLAQSVNAYYTARCLNPPAALGSGSVNVLLAPGLQQLIDWPMFDAAAFNPSIEGQFVFEQKYYCVTPAFDASKENDTIVHRQIFGNYFAYDDGSAEQAYFLNLRANAPGTTVVEYGLSVPDTLYGLAVRFARQVPSGAQKEFSIVVYKDIAYDGGTDQLVYQEDFLYPRYEEGPDGLSVYAFDAPVPMPAGRFLIGILQPAGGISDSLYIALDANRVGGNHRYFRVDDEWHPSELEGALLLRPWVGSAPFLGTADLPSAASFNLYVSPNPAQGEIRLQGQGKEIKGRFEYAICDLQGRSWSHGQAQGGQPIAVQNLPAGMYLIKITLQDGSHGTVKWVKQ